jgi:CRP/FNR family transcriptional regulator, cyclic AMP receptor protein
MNTAALWHFESVNLFNMLYPHQIKTASGSPASKKYKKGEFIYLPNQDSTHIYLVSEGSIKIGYYDNEGNEAVKSILTKGEIFGELALAGEDNRKDFAKAVVDSWVCPLTVREMQERMSQNRDLSAKILKLIGLRVMKVERKFELLAFKSARTRIVEFLKDAASWKGKKVGFETAIFTKLTHKDIGSLTGISRQTVTLILNELRAENAITFDRRRILIRDLDALK